MIRPARPEDAAHQRAIERAAGARFVTVGLPQVATDEPVTASLLSAYATSGRSWVATDEADHVVGYVLVDMIDGCAHIEQITVDPSHQGRGHGRALIDQVERWAVDHGLGAMTLTTFDAVPWNRPLYEHLGFHVLPEASPALRKLHASEAAGLGVDPASRVCMRKAVRPAPT